MKRNIDEYINKDYDMIIIGGGIYGIMLALEGSRRKLKTLLLEKNDFCGNTSLNHLRTVHGGLRYLQSADLPRFFESVKERKWFLKYFPDDVNIMSCLMPLYGKGLHRNSVLKIALLLNDILSFNKNKGISKKNKMPMGKIISKKNIKKIFPAIDMNGLTGVAEWFDASMPEHQRLYMKILKKIEELGSTNLNYVKVTGLKKKADNKMQGVIAKDIITDEDIEFNAPVVINAAGPDSREISTLFDKDYPELFKKRLLLWNILFDRETLSDSALALNPIKGGGHTYFSHPLKNRFMVGTGEIIVSKGKDELKVPKEEMNKIIDDLNQAVPELNLTDKDVLRVYSGVLPASDNERLSKREAIVDHSKNGGPEGLYSLAGVKFTTSRLVAEKLIKNVFPNKGKISYEEIFKNKEKNYAFFTYDWKPKTDDDLKQLENIVKNESVFHLSDLILRRTSLGYNPKRAMEILPKLKPLFSFSEKEWSEEKELLKKEINICYKVL